MPVSRAHADLLDLQRTAGNRAVVQLLSGGAPTFAGAVHGVVQRTPTAAALSAKFKQPPEVVAAQQAPHVQMAIGELKTAVAVTARRMMSLGQQAPPWLVQQQASMDKRVRALDPTASVADVERETDALRELAEAIVNVAGGPLAVGDQLRTAEDALLQAKAITGDIVGGGFGPEMRKHIDRTLGSLPSSHVRGNASFMGIFDDTASSPMGAASTYTWETKKLGMVRPLGMPEALYTGLDRGAKWQRNLMDAKGMLKSIDADEAKFKYSDDLALGKRKVVGGHASAVQPHINALAHGNLTDYTLRHETGHAVDQQIGFSKERKAIAAFGGWRAPDNNVAKVLLTVAENAGLSGTAAGDASTRTRLAELVDFPGDVLKRAEKILEDPAKRPGTTFSTTSLTWAAAKHNACRPGWA